jgi:hypothetical protein
MAFEISLISQLPLQKKSDTGRIFFTRVSKGFFQGFWSVNLRPLRLRQGLRLRGKKFYISGAVDEVSPFPVAHSSETTPYEEAEETIWMRQQACIRIEL